MARSTISITLLTTTLLWVKLASTPLPSSPKKVTYVPGQRSSRWMHRSRRASTRFGENWVSNPDYLIHNQLAFHRRSTARHVYESFITDNKFPDPLGGFVPGR